MTCIAYTTFCWSSVANMDLIRKSDARQRKNRRETMKKLILLPCLDSDERARHCRDVLAISWQRAKQLGVSAVEASESGIYHTLDGREVHWKQAVDAACAQKISIPPDIELPEPVERDLTDTRVQVVNDTTLEASRRLVGRGLPVLALNFANGVQPGGGFLNGARAQEEVLCRSSALYLTLQGDPMYVAHRRRSIPDSTAWAILSPDVPVFRSDDGIPLDESWLLSMLTCAAPYAPAVGQPQAGDLLQERIHSVLAIARAYSYEALVLGAWGCGAFANDPQRTAHDFHAALANEFSGDFTQVVFAISDWSPERRFLQSFCRVFTA